MSHSLVLLRTVVIWILIVKFFSYYLFGENESNDKKILGFVKAVGFVYSNKKREK